MHAACDLNITDEGLIKVTGSYIHWKSDNISETVLDRDVVMPLTGCNICIFHGLSNSSNCYDVECPCAFIASLFKCVISYLWHIMLLMQTLCIYRATCVTCCTGLSVT